jgi:hypothetical protein
MTKDFMAALSKITRKIKKPAVRSLDQILTLRTPFREE